MTTRFDNGYALLFAVDANAVARWALPDVAKDVAALQEVLIHPDRCAYPPDHVRVVQGKDATRQGLLDGLDWLKMQLDGAGDNATAVVYFTGHGWRDLDADPPTYYLVPYDVRENGIQARSLRAADFAGEIAVLQPRRLLVAIDCCHAAGMGAKDLAQAGFTGSAIPPALFAPADAAATPAGGAKGLESLRQGAGRAVLSSSQGDQVSWLRKDRRMSVFTFHLIEALTGHAQPAGGAGEVLVSDVMSYVWRHVPATVLAERGAKQEPDFQVTGNFPVALLLGGKGLAGGATAPDALAPLPSPAASATTTINTGGGDYIGGHQLIYGDNVGGDKVAGDVINVGNITGSTGIVLGRGGRNELVAGLSGAEIERLFAPLLAAVQTEQPETRAAAAAQVQALQEEVAKGAKADDKRMARLLDGLVDLVPSAVATVVGIFTTPILAGIAGPATQYVLDRIQGK